MIMTVGLFLLGMLLLIKGGDWFVDGATGIAHKFHIPEILIGATVVSIGTTLPEVMVSVDSALTGHGEISYGNAIGSVICNSALIAAITLAFRPGKVDKKSLQTPVAFFFFAAVVYSFFAYFTGYFSRLTGAILLTIFVVYMVVTVRQALKESKPQETEEETTDNTGKNILLLVIGAVLIAIGADLLVDNGTLIAEAMGVPETVIALTMVALGTSLPELITAITSLLKGHSDLSLGNVVGANLFNLVLVSGTSTLLAPFSVPNNAQLFGFNRTLILEIPVMFAVMLILCIPAVFKGEMKKAQGITLLIIYFVFVALQFLL